MNSQKPEVYALVLNWNRPDDTLECLDSLVKQEGVTPRLLVVDNASTDDSVARIRGAFPQAEILTSTENLRFAGGANLGFRYALERGAEYVFFINNDAVAAPDALKTLLAHASPQVGLLAPLIYYAADPRRVWSLGGKLNPWLLEHMKQGRGRLDTGHWPEVIEQDFVTGCCVLVPRHTLEQVGFFDERNFRHYYEDSDWSYRIRRAGLRIRVVPAAKVWHKVALSSGGSDSPDERYWMARSSVVFFRKHARAWQWPLIAFWRTGSALRTSWRLLRQGRSQSLRAYWRGLRDGWGEEVS